MKCDNKKLAQTFLHLSWNQGEVYRLEELAAEGFYYQTSFTDDILSLSEYLEFISHFRDAMPDMMLHTEEVMSEGNRVMTHISFNGTVTKDVYGIPASDSIIALEAISLWDISLCKVASLKTLIDIRSIERQIKSTLPKNPLEKINLANTKEQI